jgi:cyclophilin family peptidyl-prolyl cis-trans isomerase
VNGEPTEPDKLLMTGQGRVEACTRTSACRHISVDKVLRPASTEDLMRSGKPSRRLAAPWIKLVLGVYVTACFVTISGVCRGSAAPDSELADDSSIAISSQGTAADYEKIEAVLETNRGQIIIDLFPTDAPRHVDYFVKTARDGGYNGTTFHRLIENALIQGGDPLTKNPRQRLQYGTGGLNAGVVDEVNRNKHITGAVSAVLQLNPANPNEVKPGSSGSQFFIILNAGPAKAQLDSKFTVFGRVVEGIDVVTAISTAPSAKPSGAATERIEIQKVTIREKTPTVEQMKAMRVTIETSLGDIKLELQPEAAPNSARNLVRMIKSSLYDGLSFYRVSQKYYLETGFLDSWPQESPNRKRFFSLWPMPLEKSDLNHVRGTLSMRGIGDGMTSWYFFIISKDSPALDGQNTPVAKVTEGLEVIDKIANAEVDGDKPKQRIDIKKVSIQ